MVLTRSHSRSAALTTHASHDSATGPLEVTSRATAVNGVAQEQGAHEGAKEGLAIPGSPLFGVAEQDGDGRIDGAGACAAVEALVGEPSKQENGAAGGAGELACALLPCPVEPDIVVDDLWTSTWAWDVPLPLSLAVPNADVYTTSSSAPGDFDLFTYLDPDKVVSSQASDGESTTATAGVPLFDALRFDPASMNVNMTSTSATSTSPSFFDPQARAFALDSSLQSPLGESPFLPALSPTSEGQWSPDLDLGEVEFSPSATTSPLLFDVGLLGLGGSGGVGGPRLPPLPPIFSPHGSATAISDAGLCFLPPLPVDQQQQQQQQTLFSPVLTSKDYQDLLASVGAPEHQVKAEQQSPYLPAEHAFAPAPDATPAASNPASAESTPSHEQDDADDGDEYLPSPSHARFRSARSTCGTRASSSSSSYSADPRSTSASTRRSYAPPTVPLDAPIQPRKYQTVSRTSKKAVPKALAKQAERAAARGESLDRSELEMEADRRRAANTLAARESRKRKAEEKRMLEEENERLRGLVEELREENGSLRDEVEGLKNRAGEDAEGRTAKRARAE
ncbi:hypothetical protein JCM1841_001662 [Sporobolomyces salmonicolor]